jgi:hypothetical protein
LELDVSAAFSIEMMKDMIDMQTQRIELMSARMIWYAHEAFMLMPTAGHEQSNH